MMNCGCVIIQEAKMLIARAYRHTEKLLLANKDKLVLVSQIQTNTDSISLFL